MPEPTTATENVAPETTTTEQEPFDLDRAMHTINTLRSEIKTYKASLKDLEVLRTEKQQAEAAKLTEKEKLAKELEQTKAELKIQKEQHANSILDYQIERAATKLNIVDPSVARLLIDKSKLTFDGDNPTNVEEVLGELIKSKSYLVAQPIAGQTTAGQVVAGQNMSPTNPASRNATVTPAKPIYKREQFLDSTYYREHQKDMMQAIRENRVVD